MNKIAESLGGHMYSIEELAAWRVESINRIHALESALREAREVLALALRGFENRIGHSTQESEEIKVAVNSIDALLGKK